MSLLEGRGHLVTGLDLSGEMLTIARGRCKGRLLRQDMRHIEIDTPFDAVVCVGRGLSYMLTEKDVNMALNSFNKALRDNGVLFIDCFNAERSVRRRYGDWEMDSFEFEDMKVARFVRSTDYLESDSSWQVEWKYVIKEGGKKRIIEDKNRLRSFCEGHMREMLEENGFQILQTTRENFLTFTARKVGRPAPRS